MLEVDIPEVLAELTATFEAYEKALVTNDIETLNSLFWDSPTTVRFGTRDAERQYGHAEIAAFRRRRGAVNAERSLQNQRITTFGRDFGIANTEYRTPGSDKIRRQSQTWMRTANGWKIVGAHVSYGT
jgi:hypothetical protein